MKKVEVNSFGNVVTYNPADTKLEKIHAEHGKEKVAEVKASLPKKEKKPKN